MMVVLLEFVVDFIRVGFLNDDFVFPDPYENFVADIHSSYGEFVLVQIEVYVVILAVFILCATRAELLLSNHRGILLGGSPEELLKSTARARYHSYCIGII